MNIYNREINVKRQQVVQKLEAVFDLMDKASRDCSTVKSNTAKILGRHEDGLYLTECMQTVVTSIKKCQNHIRTTVNEIKNIS